MPGNPQELKRAKGGSFATDWYSMSFGTQKRIFLDMQNALLYTKFCMQFSNTNVYKALHMFEQGCAHAHISFIQSLPSLLEVGTGTVTMYLCTSNKETEAQCPKASHPLRVSWPTLFKETFVNGTLSPTSNLVSLVDHG